MSRVLIVGCGGREHAIALKLDQSELTEEIYCIGSYHNPGIFVITRGQYLVTESIDETIQFCKKHCIDYVIIGPEKYLELGWANQLVSCGIPVVGPSKFQAQIETSKGYCRDILSLNSDIDKYQPKYTVVTKEEDLLDTLKKYIPNVVIKADGLASGKGVKVYGEHINSLFEAFDFAQELLQQTGRVVIEEKVYGDEFSLMTLTDSETFVHFPLIKDFKRAYNRDKGPNTGGMGCVSYSNGLLPGINLLDCKQAQLLNELTIKILNCQNTLANYNSGQSRKYRGIIYGSYMKTSDGLKIIEFNARFGDPESLNALALLDHDFGNLMYHTAVGSLSTQLPVEFFKKKSISKYIVPIDYPDNPKSGVSVKLPHSNEHVSVICAGIDSLSCKSDRVISIEGNNNEETDFITTGGRTVAFVSVNSKMYKAVQYIHQMISDSDISSNHFRYRTDIGKKRKRKKCTNQVLSEQSNTLNMNSETPIELSNVNIPKIDIDSNLVESESNCGRDLDILLPQTTTTTNRYATTGVSIEEGAKTVNSIKKHVTKTFTSDTVSEFGDFAGIMAIDSDTGLVLSTDGVGTKPEVVIAYYGQRKGHYSLGQDIVNHCINDVLVKGAYPFTFLDYYGTSHLNSTYVESLVEGISKACYDSGCVLIGGETAEMPGTYVPGVCDIVGTMIGKVKLDEVINGKRDIRPGNIVMALPSSGPHTNGYSLIRQILREHPELFDNHYFMEKLCQPHRSYLPEIKMLRKYHPHVKINGLCHITGGGLVENPKRVLPNHCEIKYNNWEWPELFTMLQTYGDISTQEMLTVFNCGVGMMLIVPAECEAELKDLFYDIFKIGVVVEK
jgi:phosphoribosylamine--glycine ligase/phosphoribosylaminoimidazole synthetase